MALHPGFPTDPYVVLDLAIRWFPADETLRSEGAAKLLPPLVAELRKKSRHGGTAGTTAQPQQVPHS